MIIKLLRPKCKEKKLLNIAREMMPYQQGEHNSNNRGFLIRNHGGHIKSHDIFQELKEAAVNPES